MTGALRKIIWIAVAVTAFLLGQKGCKSESSMNEEQYQKFEENRVLFSEAADSVRKNVAGQIDLKLQDCTGLMPARIIKRLESTGIETVQTVIEKCGELKITFIPSEEWHNNRFGVVEINQSLCDNRSTKGMRWNLDGFRHKHSLGFGNGWFIYTDSDKDPF